MHEPGWQQYQQPQQHQQERLSLKDIPPLITAIAALITALVGAAAFFVGRASSPSAAATPAPTVTVTVAARASGPGSGGIPTSPDTSSSAVSGSAAQPPVRWGPELVHIDAVQLDTIPPQSGAGGGGDIGFSDQNSNPGVFGILSTKVALWTGSTEPDANQCSSQVERLGVAGIGGAVSVQKGTIVCVITDEGRPARIEVTEATSADAAAGFVLANVIVWQSP